MAVSLSGTVYTDAGTTPMGAGRTLNVSVNGAASAGSTTTASDGTYTFAGLTAASGAVLTVYLQGNTEAAATVTKGTGANMTGVDLYQDYLVLRSDNGVSLTQTNTNTSDANGATGISAIYAAASNTSLILASGKNLLIATGQSFTAATGGVVTVPGNLTINGTLVDGAAPTYTAGGSLTNNGTFTRSAGTVKLTGAGTIKSNGSTWCAVNLFSGTGTYTLADNFAAASITFTAALTLDVTAANYAVTVLAGLTNTAPGTFVARAGTVTVSNTAASTLKGGGSAFYNLTLSTASANTLTLTGDLIVSNNLTVDSGVTLNVSASNFAVTIGGNFSNSGTFTAQNGTVTLTGAGGTTQVLSGSTTFYTLTATGSAARAITFTDGTTQTVSNSLTLTGAAGQLLTLQGSSAGGWTLAVPSTQSIGYVSVSRSTATGNTAAAGTGSVSGGNNVNWTFPATGSGRVIGSPIVGPGMIVGGGIVGGLGR